jgi:hypothetical protein
MLLNNEAPGTALSAFKGGQNGSWEKTQKEREAGTEEAMEAFLSSKEEKAR